MRDEAVWQRNFMRFGALVDRVSRPLMTVELDMAAPLPSDPVLMAANHRSLADVFVALIACYRLQRPTRYIVGRAFFAKPGLGFVLRRIGAIEGGRGSGADVIAIDAILAGDDCAIMPEGKVTAEVPGRILAPLLPGVAEIWTKADCPFVAVGISGAGEVWPHHRKLPPLPRRRRNRPLVLVRVAQAARADGAPTSLDRVTELMEANCERSQHDRLTRLARR